MATSQLMSFRNSHYAATSGTFTCCEVIVLMVKPYVPIYGFHELKSIYKGLKKGCERARKVDKSVVVDIKSYVF